MSEQAPSSQHYDFASALAETARAINRPQSVDDTLQAIARAARTSVPGFDHVGISLMHSGGKVETMAATGDLVLKLDTLQYELDDGPCVSSLHEEPVIVVEHVAHSQRWPRFVPEAVKLGLKAQMALRLYVDEDGDGNRTIGGLNLYSTSSEAIADDAPQAAEVFAAQAAIALGHAQRVHHLNEALRTRQQIGQAVGVLIERYKIDEQTAFNFLTRLSNHSNTRLRDVAARIVEDALGSRDDT
jgi:transcriptional regulator with GAF, ATPase, and Fis domain